MYKLLKELYCRLKRMARELAPLLAPIELPPPPPRRVVPSTSPYVHHAGWCAENGIELNPPKGK